jgi:hypothetical protein
MPGLLGTERPGRGAGDQADEDGGAGSAKHHETGVTRRLLRDDRREKHYRRTEHEHRDGSAQHRGNARRFAGHGGPRARRGGDQHRQRQQAVGSTDFERRCRHSDAERRQRERQRTRGAITDAELEASQHTQAHDRGEHHEQASERRGRRRVVDGDGIEDHRIRRDQRAGGGYRRRNRP